MAKSNTSRYALLGALTWGPQSGYDIKKSIEGSIGNFWSESYGQIYPLLKELVAEGLATSSTVEQRGKPDRYVYALTEAGKKTLVGWLAEPAEGYPVRIEILLKLFFGRQVAASDNQRQVREFRELQQRARHRLQAIEAELQAHQAEHPDLPYWRITLSYGIHVSDALIAWCDETLDRLKRLDIGSTPSNP